MDTTSFFQQTVVYLGAAVVMVPIAKRLGFGSVLGYLTAGLIIGPALLGWVGSEAGDVMHAAEFGVVMMLFLVGLELRPSYLWRLRGPIVGLGGLQVLGSATALAGIAFLLGLPWQKAVAIGLTLALSSTALVLQTLQEKGLSKTKAGRNSFAVLLFQDIAVIPMLAIFPLLATLEAAGGGGHSAASLLDGLHPALRVLSVLGIMVLIVVVGRLLSSGVFRYIARADLPEIFTAAALLLVIGVALLMTMIGLSPALGAFLAGVVLSDSEYRHELESDIAPFKGLLLGIFFIAVGASINVGFIGENLALITGLVVALILVKMLVLGLLAWWRKFPLDQGVLFTLALCQAGEFGFVLSAFSLNNGIFDEEITRLMLSVITISLAIAPLLFLLNEKVIAPRLGTREQDSPADEIDEDSPVIIAGFGRFGHVVGRFLRTQGISPTFIDHDSEHVDLLRRLGLKVYYGDATRHELLESAGAREARVLVIALNNEERCMRLVEIAQKHFPELQIFARACSRDHAYKLICAGVKHYVLEQQSSALELAIASLAHLDRREHSARRAARLFRKRELEIMQDLAGVRSDQGAYISQARTAIQRLEKDFEGDLTALSQAKGWDNETLRAEIEGIVAPEEEDAT